MPLFNAIRRASLGPAIAAFAALSLPCAATAQTLSAQAIQSAEREGLRNMICPPPGYRGAGLDEMFDHERQRIEPARVFDNLYMLGTKTVTAWALTTPEGIILFDAMLKNSVVPTVEQHMITLGLDPADIKYVVITHAHNDHFGGARYLQDKYGALVIMTEADWSHLHSWPQLGEPAPYPRKDMAVSDGQTLTLGGTTVKFVATPGHTPGTLSPIFPVQDGANTHYVGYWGASAAGYLPPEGIAQYMGSVDKFLRADPRVDVIMSNHPALDASLFKAEALKQRRPGEPHPFVSGNARFRQWMQEIHDCAGEVLDQKVAASAAG